VLLVAETPGSSIPTTRLPVVLTDRLPPVDGGNDVSLLLAMSAATGYGLVFRVRDAKVTELFPGDPLAPFVAGLAPVLPDASGLRHLADDVAIADAVLRATAAAGASHYEDAARAARDLERWVHDADAERPTAVRGRVALDLLSRAGLVLDDERTRAAVFSRGATATPEPSGDETPYEAFSRIVTAKDRRTEWTRRGVLVQRGLPDSRRADIAALFAGPEGCAAARPPPMESPRDLVFAEALSTALSRDPRDPRRDKLPLSEWLPRYEAMAAYVEATHTAWAYLVPLVAQRGDGTGLDPRGTAVYERVTALALKHMAALEALEDAHPSAFRTASQIALVTSPGALADERLQKPLVQLTLGWEQARLARADDAQAAFEALVTGVAFGLSLPPVLREPFHTATLGALSAKLHGDFHQKTGWGVAALYAADGAYRLATDPSPRLAFSAAEVTRALEVADVPYPALAAVASAAAQYAALAFARGLDPKVTRPDRFPPERSKARERLRRAIETLGATEALPTGLIDDATDLADGLLATLSQGVAAPRDEQTSEKSGRHREATSTNAKLCTDSAARAPHADASAPRGALLAIDPPTRRALTRLSELRRRIVATPHFKEGDSMGVRRLRLLVTVLSDTLDRVILGDPAGSAKEKAARGLFVSSVSAHRIVEEAFREWDRPVDASAIADGYVLLRDLATSPSIEGFVRDHGPGLRRLLASAIALAQKSSQTSSGSSGTQAPSGGLLAPGASLLAALAETKEAEGPTQGGDNLISTLVGYAAGFYAAHHDDQGDLCLLATLLVASALHAAPPPLAIALAEKARSRVAWALCFTREVRRAPGDGPGDPSVYADDLRKLTDDACRAPDAKATLEVAQALRDFAQGKRRQARATLDAVLRRAEEAGIGVPRMTYRYEETTESLALSLSVGVSFGGAVLTRGSDYKLGLGFRTGREPEGSLTAQLAPNDGAEAGSDAARYYVAVAALATVFHFLDHDEPRAIATARRVVAALSTGVKLGPRRLRPESPAAWQGDARPAILLAAQLAADATMPLLAGDLWTVVRQGVADASDASALATAPLDLPDDLSSLPDLAPLIARTRRSLAVLAARIGCTGGDRGPVNWEEPACSLYPTALSLRVADALETLPRLQPSAGAAACQPAKSLDAFLAAENRGRYDPDLFTRAVLELRSAGKLYDAAILLTRQRRANHCSPALLDAMRATGRNELLGPLLRADLLSSAVNCTLLAGGPETVSDVILLDEVTRELPDPARNLRLLLSIADMAVRQDTFDLLARLTGRPGFVDEWLAIHPSAATAALLLEQATTTLTGGEVDLERSREAFHGLCETFSQRERAPLCTAIALLRSPGNTTTSERKRTARDAIQKLLATVHAP
jgi:hypothetical protein